MVRRAALAVVVLGLVLCAPARAQSAETAIADARMQVRRAARPFGRQAEADACARELVRSLVTGRAAVQGLEGEARTRAADALNLTTIHAAFARTTATRGLDVTSDLLPLADATALLDLEHLTPEQRRLVVRCLTVLHDLSRRPADARPTPALRGEVERDLDGVEADLRAMLHLPALSTYLRGLAHQHEQVVRRERARVEWVGGFTLHRTWPLAHVSAIVDAAYVDARTPGVGPTPEAREVDLRGLPATTRTGAVVPCAVRLDGPNVPEVARFDVETIDDAGGRVALRRVAPASSRFDWFAPSRAGRYTVLVSALLADDRVLARAFPLEVTGADVPLVGMDGEPLAGRPSVGLTGALAGQEGGLRVSIHDVLVPGKGGSIQLDFVGSTPASVTLELVGPGGERRALCRDEPLEASATAGSSLLVTLAPGEVPARPSGWRAVVTARRPDGTTHGAELELVRRHARRVS